MFTYNYVNISLLNKVKKPLRALLLSAGYGTRLKPLTDNIPKCLVNIKGKPMLEHWLSKLEDIDCEKVLINTHYLHHKVNDYLSKREMKKMTIKKEYEKELRGTAGTLIHNHEFFKGSKIIMIHVDNMTNFEIRDLIEADEERSKDCLFTMLTFKTNCPEKCGTIIRDNQMILREFHEKSSNPPSNIANAAIYAFDYDFLERLISDLPEANDFSLEVIPFYLGKIQTYHTDKHFIDIGTFENLKIARERYKN